MTKSSNGAEQITAAGGVLFRKEPQGVQLVLIYRNGVWDLPKGKLESGESIAECAVREVREEVGLNHDPAIEANLGTTEHSYFQDGVTFEKVTYWFVMSLKEDPGQFTPQSEEGIEEVRWVSIKLANEIIGYDNLKQLISRFEDGLNR